MTSTGLKVISVPEAVEASLWRRLKHEESVGCRSRLFEMYLTLAKVIARRLFRSHSKSGLDLGDFEQFSYLGLLEAIDRYDPLMRVPFASYARRRILGAIFTGLAKSTEGSGAYSHRRRLERDRQRSLKPEDPNENPDPLSALRDLVVGLAFGVILEGAVGSPEALDVVDPTQDLFEALAWRQLGMALIAEIERLNEHPRIVVRTHYFLGVAFAEIAALLKLSKGRVSQIHREAIATLRSRLSSVISTKDIR